MRIPDFIQGPHHRAGQPPADPIHVGDCLLTVGEKLDAGSDDPNSPYAVTQERIWFPQRVVHVEPEGAGHLRVWLAWDEDVKDFGAGLDDVDLPIQPPTDRARILTRDEATAIWQYFQLDVFCANCGNRAKPIVYGMPGPGEPSYLALGGCIVEPNQPLYICVCEHAWGGTENALA